MIFFRTRTESEWDELPDSKKDKMKSFSLNKVDEIINTLDPDNIILFGVRTWDEMRDFYGFETDTIINRSKHENQRLVCISKSDSPRYIGLTHPSGQSSPSDAEFDQARAEVIAHLKGV
jgi:hypothetical protein